MRFKRFALFFFFLISSALTWSQIDSAAYEDLMRLARNNPEHASQKLDSIQPFSTKNRLSKFRFEIAAASQEIAKSEYDAAMQRCIALSKEMESDTLPEIYFDCLAQLGRIFYFTKQRSVAIKYFEEGLKYAERQRLDEARKAKLHNNLGGMFTELQENEQAIFHLKKAIELNENFYQKKPEKISSLPYRLLGTNYWIQGKYELAKPILQNAIKVAERYGDNLEIIGAYLFYGDDLLKLNQKDSAIFYYEKALEVSENTNNPDIELETYRHLMKGYEEKGDFEKAFAAADLALGKQLSIYQNNLGEQISEMEVRFETEKLEQENATRAAELSAEKARSSSRLIFIFAALLLMILAIIIGWILFNQQKLKRQAAEQNARLKLQEERLRISRELHDNIGAQITVITSSIDNLEYQIQRGDEMDVSQIQKLSDFTRQTMQELRETVWAMKKEEITAEELNARIRGYLNKVGELCPDKNIRLETGEKNDFIYDPAQGINLYRIVQEAVQNALKHGDCQNILVKSWRENGSVKTLISDDGRGFDLTANENGNGLENMKTRATQVGIELEVESEIGKGTEVRVDVS